LLLEPNSHPAAQAYASAIRKDEIPATQFMSEDVYEETKSLKDKGVVFVTEPTDYEHSVVSAFDDTCGNIIQLVQPKRPLCPPHCYQNVSMVTYKTGRLVI